jgi:hypothetical protein
MVYEGIRDAVLVGRSERYGGETWVVCAQTNDKHPVVDLKCRLYVGLIYLIPCNVSYPSFEWLPVPLVCSHSSS